MAKIAWMETTHIMAKGWKKSFGDTNAPLVISFLEVGTAMPKKQKMHKVKSRRAGLYYHHRLIYRALEHDF